MREIWLVVKVFVVSVTPLPLLELLLLYFPPVYIL